MGSTHCAGKITMTVYDCIIRTLIAYLYGETTSFVLFNKLIESFVNNAKPF